jgi:hypothetical protein
VRDANLGAESISRMTDSMVIVTGVWVSNERSCTGRVGKRTSLTPGENGIGRVCCAASSYPQSRRSRAHSLG